uniref:trypsin n=1 Tax=Myripristis murdjan TaxID=586833 RepID=A0A667ZVR9_9TELE
MIHTALSSRPNTMPSAVALLVCLSILTVHGQDPIIFCDFAGWCYMFYMLLQNNASLLFAGVCDPNPCLNGGSCTIGSNSNFECLCPEPYTGKKCQRVKNVCQDVKCGRGDCVVDVKNSPFYSCKCNPPFQGADCKSLPSSPCEPNPCQNGGSCVKGNRRFRCVCPNEYAGRFCEIAATDCYEGNGETYTGHASETQKGEQCLNWHSHFIMINGEIGVSFRNPDGDEKPWCFVKRNGRLDWDYCKVRRCSEGPVTPPAPVTPVSPGQFSQCGKPQPSRTGRIFGGSKSLPGAHPWQVSVQTRPKDSSYAFSHFCGGILIESCWVLTAAHCIQPNKEYQAVLGGVHIDKEEAFDQTIPVERIIVHENYRQTPNALYNDIALLQLKVTDSPYCAKETRFVKTACLPDQTFPAGKECVVSGWGATETETYGTNQLLDARVLLISQERCKAPQVYGTSLDSSMLCAGIMQGGIDSCRGDSGGPLVCEKDGTNYVTGVVSWGEGCARRNKPGVYANVHMFLDWIKRKMN